MSSSQRQQFQRDRVGIGMQWTLPIVSVDRFVFMDRSENWVGVRGMAEVTIGSEIRTIHAAECN